MDAPAEIFQLKARLLGISPTLCGTLKPDSNGLRRAPLRSAPTGAIRTMHS